MGDRITSTESFLERAKKRVVGARQEVEKARDALTSAETKLVLEEDAVRQAEERLHVLRQEVLGVPRSPPATVPADFMQELARLRELVQDLQEERDDLRSELADQGNHAGEYGRQKKSLRSLSAPSADLSMLLFNQGTTQGASGRNPSLMMETIIDHAESTIRSGQQLMNCT